jgi:hypothetical protein
LTANPIHQQFLRAALVLLPGISISHHPSLSRHLEHVVLPGYSSAAPVRMARSSAARCISSVALSALLLGARLAAAQPTVFIPAQDPRVTVSGRTELDSDGVSRSFDWEATTFYINASSFGSTCPPRRTG